MSDEKHDLQLKVEGCDDLLTLWVENVVGGGIIVFSRDSCLLL